MNNQALTETIYAALDGSYEISQIETALAMLTDADTLESLQNSLKANEVKFEALGGRGVELADEIDTQRILIAAWSHIESAPEVLLSDHAIGELQHNPNYVFLEFSAYATEVDIADLNFLLKESKIVQIEAIDNSKYSQYDASELAYYYGWDDAANFETFADDTPSTLTISFYIPVQRASDVEAKLEAMRAPDVAVLSDWSRIG